MSILVSQNTEFVKQGITEEIIWECRKTGSKPLYRPLAAGLFTAID